MSHVEVHVGLDDSDSLLTVAHEHLPCDKQDR